MTKLSKAYFGVDYHKKNSIILDQHDRKKCIRVDIKTREQHEKLKKYYGKLYKEFFKKSNTNLSKK